MASGSRSRSRSPPAEPPGESGAFSGIELARWARDDNSEVVWCETPEGVLQAVADGHRGVEVGSCDAPKLLPALKQAASSLERLSVTGCGLSASALAELGSALGPTQIKAVGISNPGVDAQAWRAFWSALPSTVVKWDVGDNGLGDECLPGLATAASRGDVEELFLDGNSFGDIEPLLPLVRGSSTLSELDLGDNSLGDTQVRSLAEALPSSSLETLVLGRNPVTDSGATALAYILPRTKVANLHLDSTQIGDATLNALADVLEDTGLIELHIDQTRVTDAGVLRLSEVLPRSKIQFIDAGDNNLSEETAARVELAPGTARVEFD